MDDPLTHPHRKGVILRYLQIIHHLRARHHFPACHDPVGPISRRTCMPSLSCPTDKKPFSFVSKGCFLLVWMTSLAPRTALPCWNEVVIKVRSTRSLS